MVHSGSWSELTVCVAIEVEVYVSQWIDTDRFDKEAMVTLPLGSCENLLASFSLTAKSQSLSPILGSMTICFLGCTCVDLLKRVTI